MSNRNKKITTISLLVLVLAPLFFAFSLEWQQKRIQSKMKQRLEHQVLHELTLNSSDLHWFKKDKEIIINDRLFDVKAISYLENGSVTVRGLFDDEETVLVRQMKKDQQETNSRKNRQITQLIQFCIAIPPAEQELNIPCILYTNLFYPCNSDPVSAFRMILTPPPQA